MTSPDRSNSRIYFLVSGIAVIAYAGLIEWIWGWATIFEQWSNWSLTSTLIALVLMFCTYLVRAYRIRDYFRDYSRVSFSESIRITLIHNLANNLLPMRSGEASFPLMMRSSFDLPLSMTTGTLLFFRVLDLQVLLALGAIAWIWQLHSNLIGWSAWVVFVLSPLVLIQGRTYIESKILVLLPRKLEELSKKILSGTPQSFDPLIRTLALTWLNWSTKIIVFAWILMSFAELELVQAITGAMGGELSSVLPFHAPAGVGTYEAGVVAGAALTGSSIDSSVAAAVNLHILIILGTLIGGVIAPLINQKTFQPPN